MSKKDLLKCAFGEHTIKALNIDKKRHISWKYCIYCKKTTFGIDIEEAKWKVISEDPPIIRTLNPIGGYGKYPELIYDPKEGWKPYDKE